MSDQGPQVQIQLDSDSGARFNRFTRAHIKEPMAVTYVEMVPNPDYNQRTNLQKDNCQRNRDQFPDDSICFRLFICYNRSC